MSTELAKRDPRDLDLGPIRLTAIGIEFTAAPSLDEWLHVMEWVKRCESGVAFWLGDMVVHGENMFGESASQGFERETIRKFAWVASKVHYADRRKELNFSHHENVAALPAREQKRWLDLAVAQEWTAAELRRQIKAEKGVQPEGDESRCPTCNKPGWSGVYANG